MANQSFTKFVPPDQSRDYFTSNFTNVSLTQGASTHAARFEDAFTDCYFILKGKNLHYGDGDFTAGTITSATFYDDAGHVMSSIKDFSIKASSIHDDGPTTYDIVLAILGDKDKIVGSSDDDEIFGFQGRDVISGGAGDDGLLGAEGADRMTGGKGNDTFTFFGLDKGNVITDFDTDGPNRQHDLIITTANFSLKRAGDDTIVRTENGSDVRLLHVLPSELNDSDIRFADF